MNARPEVASAYQLLETVAWETMNGFFQHPGRVALRLFWLAGEAALALLDFVCNVMFRPRIPLLRARAQWLQQACRRCLRILRVEIQTQGPIPLKGLLVSNHLSYLDALVIGTVTPALFIARGEVKRWPIFGWFARLAGTLFVRHSRRAEVTRLNQEVGQALDAGGLVVLFPEATSSEGGHVFPFKSSLLEPASRRHHPLSVAFISYSLTDGKVSEDIGYYGKTTLARHLLNLLSKERISVRVAFSPLGPGLDSRKALAARLRSHLLRLQQTAAEHAVA